MTLPDLLEELKEADAEQSEKLQCWIGRTRQVMNLEMPLECDLAQALIQNSIQRACERRGWPFHVAYYPPEGPNAPYYQAYIWPAMVSYSAKADTAAEALLAAYIAAVKGEKKTISKDEIKCVARRFAWRSCNSHMKTKHDWEAGFNMGFEAANRMRAIKTRQELYGLLWVIYKRNGQDHIVETDQMAARAAVAAVKEATR